jgi:hypothetical protein
VLCLASPHFDASSRKKVGEINLKGHPEGFELDHRKADTTHGGRGP